MVTLNADDVLLTSGPLFELDFCLHSYLRLGRGPAQPEVEGLMKATSICSTHP